MASRLLYPTPMGHVLLAYQLPLRTTQDERIYTARVCGRERDDGTWEGWLEFVPDDGSAAVPTQRETTQPNLAGLEYWATGLTPVYLEGALTRALVPPPTVATPPVDTPASTTPVTESVLNPFSVFAKGEGMLRRQLGALSPRHLRAIVRAYDLAGASDPDLEAMAAPELIALIVLAVRSRLAA
jgi:hypothetical protein